MPPLGFIRVQDRTQSQHDAHAKAMILVPKMTQFALPIPQLSKGQRLQLTDLWKHPDVVADVGFAFDRIHQLTGSCVWAGGSNALFSTISAQRVGATSPTKAFLPFTLHNYGMSRHYMGDDGQGEGSLGSTFAKSLTTDGVRDWPQDGSLPKYNDSDGVSVSSHDEMVWSSYRNPGLQEVLRVSANAKLGNAVSIKTVQDIKAACINGYGVSFACDCYIGNGAVQGSGDDAVVLGKWDGNGGHQQGIHGYYEHPQFGPLYLAMNNWPRSTYPILPTQPVCSTYVKEVDVEAALRYNSEVFLLSHLPWILAAPNLLNWIY